MHPLNILALAFIVFVVYIGINDSLVKHDKKVSIEKIIKAKGFIHNGIEYTVKKSHL